MNEDRVTKEGIEGFRPGREATTGVHVGPGGEAQPRTARRRKGGEESMVPEAEFRSYYGKPVINNPVWEAPDIPGYFFLGGLAGASGVLAAMAQVTRRRRLTRVTKLAATAGAGLSVVALIHDLGRRGRFLNMLRTFKVTSPMSVGSWLLAGFGSASTVAAASEVTGLLPAAGAAATLASAVLGPGVATYTATLASNTAVPAWHDGYRELPFVFAASALSSAAGLALVCVPVEECGPVRLLGVAGGAGELVAEKVMEGRMGLAAEAFGEGKAHRYHRLARPLLALGVAGSALGRWGRWLGALGGAGLLAGSALTRFAIFEAGLASAEDPKYTVVPQRRRLDEREATAATNGNRPR